MNDILYLGETKERILKLKTVLTKEFVITNLGESNYYLGMNVDYNRTKSIYHLHQTKYIDQIIARSRLGPLKLIKAPI